MKKATPEQIGNEVEAIGLEVLALRNRMRAARHRFWLQATARGVVRDELAWQAYLELYSAATGLYSRGHHLKRFGRQLVLDFKRSAFADGSGATRRAL